MAGKPVQRLDYDNRWKDATSLYSLLHSNYRIKPTTTVLGVWEREYEYHEPGVNNGVVATGVMRWEASDSDEPKWPRDGYTWTSEPHFKAVAGAGGKEERNG